ncbi:antibiotic biosynthesis monooxygenase family protein [Paenibacillus assamensis]|uniref:antibiotic biosynthesis monooxygenase family protein n=1 Tax=Paenibacillus assamensis TaxID=311244 RepID=UPI0003FBFE27|nr:antibiotic biosynthesis monooxygenase [Paenibacillus assamensis]
MSDIAQTPQPPYYAVIFTSERTEGGHGYVEMADEMVELASLQSGFLGVESAREGVGITVSYWDSLEAIHKWKQNERHVVAQRKGMSEWYSKYKTRICKVERDYGYEAAHE